MTIELNLPRTRIWLPGAVLLMFAFLLLVLPQPDVLTVFLAIARMVLVTGSLLLVSGVWGEWGGARARRLAKEFRMQLPGAVVAIALPALAVALDPRLHWIYMPAFAIYASGCAILGVTAFSKEFEHHTLDALLAQPVSRAEIVLDKMLPAAILLLIAAAQMILSIFRGGMPNPFLFLLSLKFHFAVILPVLALCTGPLFALLVRRTLPAAALCVTVPYALSIAVMAASDLAHRWWFAESAEAIPLGWFSVIALFTTFVIYLLVGVIGSWWKFTRASLAENSSASSSTALALLAPVDRLFRLWFGSHSIAVLVRKELRLQTPAALAALAAAMVWLIWMAGKMLGTQILQNPDPGLVVPIGLIVSCGVIILAGAVTVAEEHEIGTLDWQRTLPASILRQWSVKILVATVCAFVLGVLLPLGLLLGGLGVEAFWKTNLGADGPGHVRRLVGSLSEAFWMGSAGRSYALVSFAVAFVTCLPLSIYFSSICRSTLNAAVLSVLASLVFVPAGLALTTFLQQPSPELPSALRLVVSASIGLFVAGMAAILIRTACRNFRTTVSGQWVAATQFGLVLTSLLALGALCLGLAATFAMLIHVFS